MYTAVHMQMYLSLAGVGLTGCAQLVAGGHEWLT